MNKKLQMMNQLTQSNTKVLSEANEKLPFTGIKSDI